METPAERLKMARKNAGYATAKDASDAFGWKYVTYNAHECGGRGIKQAAAERYGRAFRVKPHWILFGGDEAGQIQELTIRAGDLTESQMRAALGPLLTIARFPKAERPLFARALLQAIRAAQALDPADVRDRDYEIASQLAVAELLPEILENTPK